jgi:excisionase family DNA binding protein
MAERLLSPREVGERLGFKRTKVYEVLARSGLRVQKHNARVLRVREADLDDWIRAGCPMPSEES